MNNFLLELKRRNVFRVAMVYGVVGWLLAQVSVMLENAFALPAWFDTLVISLLLLGFPIALILSWAFELTPEGFRPTGKNDDTALTPSQNSQKKQGLNKALIGALILAVAVLLFREMTIPKSPQTSPALQAETQKEQSIAVLPFEDFSPNKDQDYFANGISEELLNVLARIKGLRVSSRTSAFAFKGQDTPIFEIGEALNVAHVLEGSIRKSGGTLRITAQLIDTKSDVHLWSETYDRPLTADNIFKIQDEIAAAIVAELKGQLKFETSPDIPLNRTDNLEAYQLYLRARENMRLREPETLKAAEDGFKQAIASDPNFAPAYAGLAETYLLSVTYGGMEDAKAIRLASPFVEKALALDPNSAEALGSASLLASKNFEFDKALDFAKRSIAANPNYSDGFNRLGIAYGNKDRPEESLKAYQDGLKIDPLSSILLTNTSYGFVQIGDMEQAKEAARRNIRLHPKFASAHLALAAMLWEEADLVGAHSILKDAQALNPKDETTQALLSIIYTDTGFNEEALKAVITPSIKAEILAKTGQFEDAIDTLPSDANALYKMNVHFFTRDFDTAMKSLEFVSDRFGIMDAAPSSPVAAYSLALSAFIYQRVNHEDTDASIKILDNYFNGKNPSDFSNSNDLIAGAIYEIVKGTPNASLDWVNRLIDLNYLDNVLQSPFYDGLHNLPDYAPTLKRMDTLRRQYRGEIEKQLANPKPNWIMTP